MTQPCLVPGCPALVERGRCAVHRRSRQQYNRARRGTSAQRGYDRAWRKVRRMYLHLNPHCEQCWREGRTNRASLVDHIIPLRQGGARLEPANLQALCRSCHATKTSREQEQNHA